jgi:hydrogenase nickel incorporation protein HypA/HybF
VDVHELSIALSMIDEITEQMARRGGGRVEVVHLRIGVLSGIEGSALRFAYEMAAEGTELEGSRLEIESVALLVHCPACGEDHRPELHKVLCPRCVTPAQEIVEGRELEVRALEILG